MATPPRAPLAPARPEPPDHAARRRALATDTSFIVRAPAGSGKTELLVSRFLALLAVVEQPEQILAVTFTRKAAAEMRARVLDRLTTPDSDLAVRARQHAQDRGWDLLTTPARLHISTLDSLALSLTTRMPWLSRLGAVPQPVDDATPLYRAAARIVLTATDAATVEAAHHLLLRLGNDVEKAEESLAHLLAHRDQWLPLLAAAWRSPERQRADPAGNRSPHSERPKGATRAKGGEPLASSSGVDLRAQVEATLRAHAEAELAACRALLLAAAPGTPDAFWPEASADALPQWHDLAAQFLTKGGNLLKRPAPPCALSPDACAALHRTRSLVPLWIDDPSWSRLTDLLLLLPGTLEGLRRIFRERGQCDFPELTMAALDALSHEGAPTALAFALDAQLRHLLVDEFQDTSTAQCDLLLCLMSDWQPGDGRTLFLVGDPMQSIYRFRDARVDLFLGAASGCLGHIELEPLQLTANFRSQQNLVTWCNDLFAAVFPAGEDRNAGRVEFRPAQPTLDPVAPAVQTDLLRTHAEEATRVADIVQQELAADSTSEIAILVHNRAHLAAILPALRARKIPYQGMNLASLASSPIAADLAALARAILDPCDRIAWLALLRAPWCALQLADLEALAGADASPTATLAGLLATRSHLLSPDARDRALATITLVQQAAAERGRRSLRSLTEWCWQRLEGAACATGTANPADAEAMLVGLDQLALSSGLVDAAAIEQLRANLYAPPDPRATKRVQVMTIHHAKGLQFPVVILPGLARTPRPSEPPLLRWYDCAPASAPGATFALAARPERSTTDLAYDYLAAQDRERDEHERLRVLYVAATRACKRLYLLAVPPHKNGAFQQPYRNMPIGRLWSALKLDLPSGPAPAEHYVVPAPAPLRRLLSLHSDSQPDPLHWRPSALAPPPSEATHAPHFASALHRRVGIAVHAMLQRIGGQVPLTWASAQLASELRRAGLSEQARDWPQVLALASGALRQTLADPRGQWILAPHDDQHNEWQLTGLVAGVQQQATIDRSFLADGVRWIIDYKTAHHQGAGLDAFLDRQLEIYTPQLRAYSALVANLDPHPIRCALFFPLLHAWRTLP